MGELTHKAARAAFGKAIDLTLKHVEKDREKGLLQLVDLTEKFMGDNFPSESYEGARNLIRDPESKWMQYVNRALDEIDLFCIVFSHAIAFHPFVCFLFFI